MSVESKERRMRKLLPLWVFIFVMLIVVSLWQSLKSQELSQTRRLIDQDSKHIKYEIIKVIDSQILGLVRMGKRWDASGGVSEKVFLNYTYVINNINEWCLL